MSVKIQTEQGLVQSKEELTQKLGNVIRLANFDVTPLFHDIWQSVHPAIDVIDDTAFVGVNLPCELSDDKGKTEIRELHFLINSKREKILCHKEELSKLKLRLKHSVVKLPNRWSLQSIKDWLDGKASVDPQELYIAIKTSFETYIEFEDSTVYDFLTLWTIGTYFFDVFNAYPYLYIGGMKQVGKTKLLTLLSLLCHNAIFSNNISTASAFRLIQSGRCTLLMDETEKLRNPEREIDFRNMLYAGYKKGALVYRTHKDTLKPEPFEVYSPKALANIRGLEDVLEDRCITVIMKRGKNLEIVNREIPLESEVWPKIRDTLYVFYLSYFNELSELSEQVNLLRETDLKQRDLEVWKPILTLALFFSKHFSGLFQKISEFAKRKAEEKEVENRTEALDLILAQTLALIIKNDAYYKVKQIKDVMAENFDEPQKWLTSRWIGNSLRRLGFTEKRRVGTGYEYFFKVSQIQDLAERLGLEGASLIKFTNSLSSQPSLTLAQENIQAVYKALVDASKIRGTATTEEVALEASLPLETVEACLVALEREGKAFSPREGWWKLT
jgi:hypothetical protein